LPDRIRRAWLGATLHDSLLAFITHAGFWCSFAAFEYRPSPVALKFSFRSISGGILPVGVPLPKGNVEQRGH
jgi:hypothetical protein